RRRDHGRPGLSHPTDGHAGVHRLNDDAAPIWSELFHYCVRDFAGKALLHLRPPRVTFDQPRELAQPDDTTLRDVPDVRVSCKGKQMVFADRGEWDIAQDNHFFVVFVERYSEMGPWIIVQ